jgi:transglutaminase-like putative cysteine protease
MSAGPAPRGDCFEAALAAASYLWEQGEEAFLAHGRPVGRGPENGGVRYWHAWAEAKVAGRGWLVIDISNGHRVGMKRTAYYRAGQIDPAQVHRFTQAQAVAEMAGRGHYGPWSDSYDSQTPPEGAT